MAINDLPPEILSEILLLSIYFYPVGRRIHKPGYIFRSSDRFAPINFVHVCRYWRAVAFATKHMWTSFCGNAFKSEALAHWTSFSRPLPLHLTLSVRSRIGYRRVIDDRTLAEARERLCHYGVFADRWDSLCFDFGNYEDTEALADMLQTTALRSPLQRFEICLLHDNISSIIDKLSSSIASFPSLRHFSWIVQSFQGALPHRFPWHALEDVYVDACVPVEELIQCLMECTSATTVTLLSAGSYKIEPFTGTWTNPHSKLPKLKSLTINEFCDPHRFLQHFTLPSLVSLEIQTLKGSSPALQDFLVRSACPLRHFTLKDRFVMGGDEIINCLATPYLRSVPHVVFSVPIEPEPYFTELVEAWPSILDELPGITAWPDDAGCHIGWRKSRE